MDVLQTYYQAWESKDIKLLQTVLHPELFGIRTYTEQVYYDVNDVVQGCMSNTISHVKPYRLKQEHNTIRYQLDVSDEFGNHVVIAKAIIKDDRIFKLYEEIMQDTMRVKCICMYDGTMFSGYQKQPNETTIQQSIEEAIEQALNLDDTPMIHASGRTDKGVHAIHQVFHMDIKTTIPMEKIPMLINNYLPDSIYVTECELVDQTFHSRYDVILKEYRYVINKNSYNPIQRNYEWFVPNLNIDQLKQILQVIVGTHDFQTFTKSSDKSTIRTIEEVVFKQDDTHLYIHIKGTGFMRYMVRYIIGAAVLISLGKLPFSMKELLEKKDPTLLKDLAPAGGLYLYDVCYD